MLFTQVLTTNAYMLGMLAILAACTVKLGPLAMFNLYLIPYWINVVWLDIVTYLHHHGSHDVNEKMPWYRGEVRVGNSGAAFRGRTRGCCLCSRRQRMVTSTLRVSAWWYGGKLRYARQFTL